MKCVKIFDLDNFRLCGRLTRIMDITNLCPYAYSFAKFMYQNYYPSPQSVGRGLLQSLGNFLSVVCLCEGWCHKCGLLNSLCIVFMLTVLSLLKKITIRWPGF